MHLFQRKRGKGKTPPTGLFLERTSPPLTRRKRCQLLSCRLGPGRTRQMVLLALATIHNIMQMRTTLIHLSETSINIVLDCQMSDGGDYVMDDGTVRRTKIKDTD